ncbi:aminotransferase class V-fold PLP-dependent enzyme [Ruegeria sp. 2012CJ41-6]|uniref:Aminotransferase class V-fold PLP-dependent enzyme n=1 Tax=Ruegeria spongiae TaxID=2942209 RepID=A0ABT0Q5C3_9RHOB|nr:aminotransferase class V-fold PLP-dependent enzyme [Ruegeria spongiae]MCL6285071.1 aminotransferase class V-fold PLP-dependent enzyme [Ruegeria spongiae]
MQFKTLPKVGRSESEIELELDLILQDNELRMGKVFQPPKGVEDFSKRIFAKFMSENAIKSQRGDWIGEIEKQVIQMCVGLFNAPGDASGTFTSGGSESIYTAVHAIREWAKTHKPHITEPEIVVPYSAHPTFTKGCHYFGLKEVRAGLDETWRASPELMDAAVTKNTIAVVASAPCFPYGLYDPVQEIGDIATRHDLWMHVDACVGGYLAPFLEELNIGLPRWDFRVGAVQSISADLHKLGCCLKPASTVLWRSEQLLQYHHFHPSNWPCGTYDMVGFAGSRTAGPIFAAWATLQHLGVNGFVRVAEELLIRKKELFDGINEIEGLKCWDNHLVPVVFEATSVDLAKVKAEMSNRKWNLYGTQEPPLINICLDPASDDNVVDEFLSDLSDAVRLTRQGSVLTKGSLSY